MCGMLQCRHLNERLEFGMESVAVLSHSFISDGGSIIPCRTAVIDLGLQSVDPGLTPDGAKCGDKRMCVSQKCLSIDTLRLDGKVMECPDCNGNGICNSKGHCHCNDGYGPPFCDGPGVGGSIDSGPASDPDSGRLFTKLMYIFFIGVIPCCSLFALFIYYWRQNNFQFVRKSPSLPKPNIKHHIAKSSGSPQTPTFTSSSPNSPDDMNSSLLRPTSDVENNFLFGKFKGFTLKPLPDKTSTNNSPKVAYVHPVSKSANDVDLHIIPTREAPPPPVPKHQGVNAFIDKFNNINSNTSVPPALPPLNKGSTARPLISNPILETSTSNAKELPINVKQQSNSLPRSVENVDSLVPDVLINPTSTVELKKPKDGTLSRIQSFLKKEKQPEKIHKQLKTIDKDKLKDIQISSPILITQVPLKDADDSSTAERKSNLNRAQSMRDPPSPPVQKPALQSFGSMRNPRPKSIVDRPTLPPPPRPPAVTMNSIEKQSSNEYDDCEPKEAGTPDNIYSVIEESPMSPPLQQGSLESMGLLGEIVNEIENRKFDAIYIASNLKKKSPDESSGYANVKTPVEDEYQPESNASTTSSGYMRPIQAPVARIPPSQSFNKMPSTTSSNSLSSFKSAKSSSGPTSDKSVTSTHEPLISPTSVTSKIDNNKMKKSSSDLGRKKSIDGPESEYKTPTSNKPVSDRPSLKKTKTPPSITVPKKPTTTSSSLRKRSPSPTKPVLSNLTKNPSKPKTLSKPSVTSSVKPTTPASTASTKTSLSNGILKSQPSSTAAANSANKVFSAAANKKSNVAALQQKFENTK